MRVELCWADLRRERLFNVKFGQHSPQFRNSQESAMRVSFGYISCERTSALRVSVDKRQQQHSEQIQ